MLSRCAIALLCDSPGVDGSGDVITFDRSRHGIHPYLGPDGQTVARMPTLDAINGKYTFDGDDFMLFPEAKDVEGIIAGMGGPYPETYVFLFNPFVQRVGSFQTLLFKGDTGSSFVRIRQRDVNDLEFRVTEGGGGNEIITSSATIVPYNNGRYSMFSFVRDTNVQEIWNWDDLDSSDTDISVDATQASSCAIGSSSFAGSTYLWTGNALRAFIYGRFRATQTWLRQLEHYLREVL